MQRYRLKQGKLQPHPEGEWVKHDDAVPNAKLPQQCLCGCRVFMWWIEEQKQFSLPTAWADYNPQLHPRARCYRCDWLVSEVETAAKAAGGNDGTGT